MEKTLFLLLGCLMLLPFPLAAEIIQVAPGLDLRVDLPSDRWTVSHEAPEFLVEETAEHLEHELRAQGKAFPPDALNSMAQKRLAANEAYLFDPATGACLVIDFSPLRKGEAAPDGKTIAASARAAGESLESEEGATDVRHQSRKSEVRGAEAAYRIDASYRHHGEALKFIGIVGFRSPYWFYLYYTDPLRSTADEKEMEQILRSLVLSPSGG